MMIYVLSFYGNAELPNVIDGVWGVFDAMEKAVIAVGHWCKFYNENIFDFDCGLTLWRFFTNEGTYVIERVELNDEGI